MVCLPKPKRSVLIAARLITAVVSLAPRRWSMDVPWGGPSELFGKGLDADELGMIVAIPLSGPQPATHP